MIEYLYRARLVPIGERVNVPTLSDRTPWHYTFDRATFALEQKSNRKIPVCLDHDRLNVVGHVEKLTAAGDWWQCTFKLDPGTRSELKVGAPVSVGLQTLGIGSGTPFITEVSLVEFGAIKGAEIVSWYPLPQAQPPPPKPTPKPITLELHLERRLQWKETRARLEALGINVSNYGPPLPLHPSEMESTKPSAVAGEAIHGGPPIIRRQIGQVTAVGGMPLRTRQGDPIRYVGHDIEIDRPDGSTETYCGREGREDFAREHGIAVHRAA